MSQDVCPVTRAGAIVEPAGTWGDPSATSRGTTSSTTSRSPGWRTRRFPRPVSTGRKVPL